MIITVFTLNYLSYVPQKPTAKWEAHNSPLASDRGRVVDSEEPRRLCSFSTGCLALVNYSTFLHLTFSTCKLDIKSEVTYFERKLRRNAEEP